MSTYHRLRRLFEHISFAALATQATACSQAHTVSRTDFDETVPCGDHAAWVAGVEPASAVDYLAIRRISVPYFDEPVPDPALSGEVGIACDNATDADTCATALSALPTDAGFDEEALGPLPYGTRYQLVWTRGDQVGAVTNETELLEFLGSIDSAEEAAIVARFAMGHSLVCDGVNARMSEGGIEVITTTGFACGEGTERSEHILLIAPDGTITVRRTVVVEVGDPGCAIGRLTDGAEVSDTRPTDLGSYFAEMASLEAAAVVAFERLAIDLEALGAPAELVTRAREARDDEARHTQRVDMLRGAFGGERCEVPAAKDPANMPGRSALDIALENAREGCVRETYGAMIAMYQSRNAKDARVAGALAEIALDETRHAALSWDLHEWLETQLNNQERAMVRLERAAATRSFEEVEGARLGESDREAAGLPGIEESRAMFQELAHHLGGLGSKGYHT